MKAMCVCAMWMTKMLFYVVSAQILEMQRRGPSHSLFHLWLVGCQAAPQRLREHLADAFVRQRRGVGPQRDCVLGLDNGNAPTGHLVPVVVASPHGQASVVSSAPED